MQKSYGLHHYPPKLQYQLGRSTSFFCNKVVSLSLLLMGAVQELPKNCNFSTHAGAILVPIVTATRNKIMPDH